MNELRRHLQHAAWLACCAGPPACDSTCEPPPDLPGNQDPGSLEPCPSLPDGVEPITGLVSARASDRFDGLTVTLSTLPLSCGEPAAQHGYCSDDERGLTVGFPADELTPGPHALAHPLHVEFETPDALVVGGGGELREATVELFEITDACVTGRIIDLTDEGGPFDGGFQAPRCSP